MKTKYGLLINHSVGIDLTEFQEMVAINAYYRAEKRGFETVHEMNDWLDAEKEIKRGLSRAFEQKLTVLT